MTARDPSNVVVIHDLLKRGTLTRWRSVRRVVWIRSRNAQQRIDYLNISLLSYHHIISICSTRASAEIRQMDPLLIWNSRWRERGATGQPWVSSGSCSTCDVLKKSCETWRPIRLWNSAKWVQFNNVTVSGVCFVKKYVIILKNCRSSKRPWIIIIILVMTTYFSCDIEIPKVVFLWSWLIFIVILKLFSCDLNLFLDIKSRSQVNKICYLEITRKLSQDHKKTTFDISRLREN